MTKSTKIMQLRMPLELHEKVRKMAVNKGLTVTAFMRMLLTQAVKDSRSQSNGE